MGNRRTTLSNFKLAGVAAAMMMGSADLSALGLGVLEVQSNLDQPLNGFIELRVAPGDDVSTVKAVIASREDFDNLGIEYPEYLRDIKLDIEDVNGATVLRVNSNDVVIKEPFIHFLVRVDYSGGSFLREYTALIDPPVYAAESPKTRAEPVPVGTDQSFQTEALDDISGDDLTDVADEVLEETGVEDSLSVEDSLPVEDSPLVEDSPIVDDSPLVDDAPLVEDSFPVDEEEPSLGDEFYQPEAVAGADESDATSSATDAQYGPVARGESLSVIAQQLQSQFPDLSIYQIMKVLFEENRGAFISENINGLVSGAILNIGDLDAIRAVDVEESKEFFRTQINEWDPSVLVAGNDSLKVGRDEYNAGEQESDDLDFSPSNETNDSFQVGSSSDTETFVSEGSGNSNEGEVIAMRNQINELEASLASSSLENQELSERISILEGQLADMNQLVNLNVEDADLANLENALTEQNDAASLTDTVDEFGLPDVSSLEDSDALDSLTDEPLLADSDELLDDAVTELDDGQELLGELTDNLTDLDDGLDDLVDADELVNDDGLELLDDVDLADGSNLADGSDLADLADGSDIADGSDSAVTPAVTAPAAKQSIVDKVIGFATDNLKLLGGFGILLLGGIAAFFFRRRRADEEFEISMLSIESNSQSIDDNIASEAASISASVTHSVANDEGVGDKETSFLTVYSDSDAVVQADEVDPIAEADVYIAYRRHEQAEEVLLDGISSHPQRVDIKHKLLGLYHDNKNSEGFERVAEELYSQRELLSSDIWQDVCRMGKETAPDNPLFDLSADDLAAAGQVTAVPVSDLADDPAVEDVATIADKGDIDELPDTVEETLIEGADEAVQMAAYSEDRSEVSELDEGEIEALTSELSIGLPNEEAGLDIINTDLNDNSANEVDADIIEFASDNALVESSSSDESTIDDDSEITISEVQEVSGLEIDADYDEARTQYELAKVFVDLGDEDGARKILKEIVANSDNAVDVLKDSQELLDSIGS